MVEKEALRVEHLERVVFQWIMRRRDGKAAARVGGAGIDLDGRCGKDTNIDDLAAGRQQAAMNRVLEHGSTGARVAADDDAAGPNVGPEGLCEGAGQGG